MTEVFGKPIVGEVQQYSRNPVEQADPDLLRQALDSLFELKNVKAIRWEQYTPYFNDGDPCEFSANEARILIEGVDEDRGDYSDGYLDSFEFKYYKDEPYIQAIENLDEITARFKHVAVAIGSGTNELFLKKTFGDPAQVTATREGFSVDFYDHD